MENVEQVASEYWVNRPISELPSQILSKFEGYKKTLDSSGYGERMRLCYQNFYGFNKAGTLKIERDKKGKVARMRVPHAKSLLKRMHIMVTENKLAFQPHANNTDSKSEVESDLGRGICDYYGSEKKMSPRLREACRRAIVMIESWIGCEWDDAAGYELRPDESNRPITTGDQTFTLHTAFDIASSTSVQDEESPWVIVRKRRNKYDLATMFPEFAADIISSSIESMVDPYDLNVSGTGNGSRGNTMDDSGDFTYTFTLFHKKTPACPEGLEAMICAGHVLKRRELKYKKIPYFRLTAGTVMDSVYGDSPAVDLLVIQEAMDQLFSATLTNNLNNALQLLWSPSQMIITENPDGSKSVQSAQRPEGLNLTSSAGENYKFIDSMVNHEQLVSGVNDAARGNPSSNLKSGASLALVLAQAIQYMSDLQANYAEVAGEVASCLIDNIKEFATGEMTAMITGSTNIGRIKKFQREDILNIDRVTVDMGNPMLQTLAGRTEIMEGWVQKGLVTDPKQILTFYRTGEFDTATESAFSDAMLIKEENELIKRGIKPKAIIFDNHDEHYLKHKAIASSPEVREDGPVMEVLTAHLDEHLALKRSMPPDMIAMITGQPLPPVGPPAGAGGPPGPGPRPQVAGATMPGVPAGTPPQVAANYQQQLDAMPAEQMMEPA